MIKEKNHLTENATQRTIYFTIEIKSNRSCLDYVQQWHIFFCTTLIYFIQLNNRHIDGYEYEWNKESW